MYWTGCLQQATDIQPTDTPRYPSSTIGGEWAFEIFSGLPNHILQGQQQWESRRLSR